MCVGVLANVGLIRSLSRAGIGSVLAVRRDRVSAVRFYECATYSRLSNTFTYPISFLAVLCAYIIYDLDLTLIVADILLLGDCGWSECLVLGLIILLTVFGLTVDYRLSGYSFELR